MMMAWHVCIVPSEGDGRDDMMEVSVGFTGGSGGFMGRYGTTGFLAAAAAALTCTVRGC